MNGRRLQRGFRFVSVEAEEADRRARRERFQRGEVHLLEKDVLAACLEYCQRHPKVAWAKRSNVGSGFLIRRDVYERLVRSGALKPSEARFARYGVKDGGDITGMLKGGRRLEVETKSDKGKPSDEQQAFGDAVNGGGGLWICAHSVDDVERALR